VLRNPSITELAVCLDLNINVAKGVRDVLVIGAGPAGLAAAVYTASEGLKTLVMRSQHPVARQGRAQRSKTTWASPPGFLDRSLRIDPSLKLRNLARS
jgi:thioredoxin reductase (NADPH)